MRPRDQIIAIQPDARSLPPSPAPRRLGSGQLPRPRRRCRRRPPGNTTIDAANGIRACRCSRYVSSPACPSRSKITLAERAGAAAGSPERHASASVIMSADGSARQPSQDVPGM